MCAAEEGEGTLTVTGRLRAPAPEGGTTMPPPHEEIEVQKGEGMCKGWQVSSSNEATVPPLKRPGQE